MKIVNIEIKNFKAIRSLNLPDLPNGIIGVVGDNGQGKSTLLSAVAYALYGPETLTTGTADAVTWGEKSASVYVEFDIGAHTYLLKRSQTSRGTSSAVLQRDDTERSIAEGPSAVTAEIEKLLGIDRVGFLASVFSRQEDLLGIGSLQPAKRTSTILRLLGIDQIDAGIKKVNERTKDFNSTLDILRRTIEQTPQIDVRETKRKVSDLIEKRTALIAELETRIPDLVQQAIDQRDYLKTAHDNWLQYRSKLSSLDEQLTAARAEVVRVETALETKPMPPALPDDITLIDIQEYHRRQIEFDSKSKEIISALNSMVCPTCNRPFDDAEERSARLSKEQKRLEVEAAWLKENARNASWSERYISDQQRYETVLLPNYQSAEVRLHEAVDRMASLRERRDALEEYPDVSIEYESAQRAVETALLRQQEVKNLVESHGREITLYQEELARYAAVEQNRKDQIAQVGEYERQVVNHSTTSEQLKKFKEVMVAGIVPHLSEKASAFISEMTEGRYNEIVLTPQYDIQYRNDLGDLKSFGNLSGGEKDVFALALRLAIADLRAGNIGILVLDEVFESLDSDRQEATWNLLQKLSNRYDQVFIVTHVPAFKDRAPFTVESGRS